MGKISLISDEFIEANYIAENKMITIEWKVINIPSEKYREVYTYLLDLYPCGEVLLLLIDSTNSGLVSPSDREWFQENAVPKAAEKGLIKTAVVIKNNPFKKYYANAILKSVTRKTTYEMKVFTDYEKANEWILAN